MNTTLSRFLTSATLMIWGVILSYFYLSGRVSAYLHPAFHIGTLLSGCILVLLAAGIFFLPPAGSDCGGTRSAGGLIISFVVLTLPLGIAVGISPNGFGATTITNRGLVQNIDGLPVRASQADGSVGGTAPDNSPAFIPKNDKGQLKLETIDLLYAASEPTMRDDFENKEIEMIGQFMPARTGNPNGDRFNLVRMYVMCCAADARPVAVAVQSKETFPEMTWLKVTGKATFPVESGKRGALFVADSVKQIDAPADTFIY